MQDKTDVMTKYSFSYLSLIEDPYTGTHTAVVQFPTGKGAVATIDVPASMLSQPRILLQRLQDMDAVVPTEVSHRSQLLKAIAAAQPNLRECYATGNGWPDDRGWYASGGAILGTAPKGQRPPKRSAHGDGEPGQLQCRGKAEAWRDSVGRHSRKSSVAMLAVCAALAAPLLVFTTLLSFALCLAAPSRAGKTIACLIGGSLIGIGRIEDFISWNSTD